MDTKSFSLNLILGSEMFQDSRIYFATDGTLLPIIPDIPEEQQRPTIHLINLIETVSLRPKNRYLNRFQINSEFDNRLTGNLIRVNTPKMYKSSSEK